MDNFPKTTLKMTSDERRLRRFSEEFKREQVKLIESGVRSIAEVSRLYEVKAQNVREWVKKFGTQSIPGVIVVQTQEEVNRIKELEREIGKLKGIIGELHVELLYKNEVISLAKEKLGTDFEKKIKS